MSLGVSSWGDTFNDVESTGNKNLDLSEAQKSGDTMQANSNSIANNASVSATVKQDSKEEDLCGELSCPEVGCKKKKEPKVKEGGIDPGNILNCKICESTEDEDNFSAENAELNEGETLLSDTEQTARQAIVDNAAASATLDEDSKGKDSSHTLPREEGQETNTKHKELGCMQNCKANESAEDDDNLRIILIPLLC